MKIFLKILKWSAITIVSILIVLVLFVRFSRFSDKIIYQMNGTDYAEFKSVSNYEEFYLDVDQDLKLHGVLFKPDSIEAIGTIFHYPGKGMHLMNSMQESYKPLLKKGFQIFCYERRDFGKSTGEATSSLLLKGDALFIFDTVATFPSISK